MIYYFSQLFIEIRNAETDHEDYLSDGLILDGLVLISSSFFVKNSITTFITFNSIINSQASLLATF